VNQKPSPLAFIAFLLAGWIAAASRGRYFKHNGSDEKSPPGFVAKFLHAQAERFSAPPVHSASE
jgi:hypothetical protein